MTSDACAARVERGDPDRFAATMAAPPEARPKLWPLYAFNLEVARAPWVTPEPMIAEMRLQWWIDTLDEIADGKAERAHEVATALAAVLREQGVDPTLLRGIAVARRWDISHEPFVDRTAFDAHIDATSGNLMWAAALALGAPGAAEPTIRDFAWGAGLAAWLTATPELEARGRLPLVDGRPDAVARLARDGLSRIASARQTRHRVPRQTIPALWPGWQARAVLSAAAADPSRVGRGTLGPSEFRKRLGLLGRAATGFW